MVGVGSTGAKYSINFSATSNQSISVPYNVAFDNFSAQTISCWIYQTATPSNFPALVNKGYPSNHHFYLQENPSGKIRYIANAIGSAPLVIGNIIITNNVWHHVVGTWDGSTQSIYVDGVLDVSGTNTNAPGSLNAPLTIGGFGPTLNQSFSGNITDVRVYNVALTAAQVQGLYIGADVASGEVVRFPFPEGVGTTTKDSINGLVGTLNNSPTWASFIPTQLIPPTLYKWNYTVRTSARGINAISDYITINADNGWQAGPNDDQYYTLGAFFGYTEGKVDTTSVLLELNLMFQTNGGLPTITFQALYNGTPQHTFTTQVAVGHTYVRQITVNPPVGTGGTGGDSSNPQATATWTLIDTTGRSEDFTLSIPPDSRFNGLTYSGITWWTFAPAPTSTPLEYDVSITNYGYSFDFGDTYNQFTGSDMTVLTDGRYAANNLIYPVNSFHMITPGQQPKIGMLRT